MPSLLFDINLAAHSFQSVYQGRANRVLVKSRDGRNVSVPAHHFRAFLSHSGVQGSFELQFSESGELQSLRRLAQ